MRAPLAVLALLVTAAGPVLAADPPELPAQAEIKVERVKPMRDKHPTLVFLRENRDFIRSRFDRLGEKPIAQKGEATAIDPRFLAYAGMLASLDAERDSLARSEESRARRDLFESVGQLTELENQLDQLEGALDHQRGRLATLERDFMGDQRTELLVVVSGYSASAPLSGLSLELEDGGVLNLELTEFQRESLRQGAMVEVFHGFVEPRAQTLRLGLAGAAWPAGDSGWLELDPVRDRLNLLRLDLSQLSPATGVPGVRAGTWVHASSALSIDG